MAVLDPRRHRRKIPTGPSRSVLNALARDLLASFESSDPAIVARCARQFLAVRNAPVLPAVQRAPAEQRPPIPAR